MRILHASHTHLKTLGSHNYFLPVRINNGFIRNNHEVFWFSDRDVARHFAPIRSRRFGVRACNRKFLEVCRNFEPDVIALSTQDVLHAETLAQARRMLPNVAIFQYFIDPLFLDWNMRNVSSKADVVDWTFVTTGGPVLRRVAGRHSRAAYIPNPVDPSIDVHRCHEYSDQPYDVFFAGHISKWLHPDDLRGRAPSLIADQLPDVRCAFYGHSGRPSVFGAAFMRALGEARIGLNFSQRDEASIPGPGGELYLYSSDRIGLYMGNGLLVFTTRSFNLSDVYGSDAIVEVDGADDFIDKLRYYVDHEDARRAMAAHSYALAHAEFNERLVAQYMVETTLGLAPSHAYRWPTESFGR